jgi:hypothetical protein
MSSFKDYYAYTFVFEEVFERYYKKGYFGSIDKELIKEDQKDWFDKFVRMLVEKRTESLTSILGSYENKISREYFGGITNIDIKYKTREDITTIVEKYLR